MINGFEKTCLFYYVRKCIAGDWLSSLPFLDSVMRSGYLHNQQLNHANRDAENEGAAAASAAALASPCKASMGALRLERGRFSSDSSSEESAVLGTTP